MTSRLLESLTVEFPEPNCLRCQHYWEDNMCAAFPDGIPIEFMSGRIQHLYPHPLQPNQIIYAPDSREDDGFGTSSLREDT
jgi:hypothetical protein